MLLIISFHESIGQREIHFSQYMFQGILINPAYAGNQNQIESNFSSKSQWTNLKSTPTIYSFNIHAPILHKSAGIGAVINREKFGLSTQQSFLGCFSYKVRLLKGEISLGVESGLRQYNFNSSELNIEDKFDPNLIPNEIVSVWDLGFGMYYQNQSYHLGVSAKKLNGNAFRQSDFISLNNNQYYSLLFGKKVKISTFSKLLTTCFINYSINTPVLAEITSVYQSKIGLWTGIGYRTSSELTFLLGFGLKKIIPAFSEDFSVGYAYDYGFNALQNVNNGSHELMLIYKFGDKPTVEKILNEKKAVHPVFF